MKTRLCLGLLVASSLATAPALADDRAACLAAASKGQRLRDTHKLVEAREQLRICAAATCPAVVQTDCAAWLADVEKTLPTVVLAAKDGAGADLLDVRVTVDGQPLTSKLEGQAVPMNAGPHTFHFEGANGATLDQQVVVKEGEKNQPVAVVLKAPPAPPEPARPSPVEAGPPTQGEPQAATGGAAQGGSSWKTVGWILAGVGVVGLGVGTAFGFAAMGDKNSANCDASHLCDGGPLSSARSAATACDISLIAGGVLLAGGLTVVLLSPSAHHESAMSMRLAPVVGTNGGGATVGGSW
jgi:hypothetical protein